MWLLPIWDVLDRGRGAAWLALLDMPSASRIGAGCGADGADVMGDSIKLNDASLDQLEAVMAIHAPHRLPIIRAIRQGKIAAAEYTRKTQAGVTRLKRMPKPLIAILGDDDEEACGPAGWAAARPLLKWANALVVHATGPRLSHYETAAAMTVMHRRVLLIETDSANLAAWLAALPKGKPTLIIRASAGSVHPIDRGMLH